MPAAPDIRTFASADEGRVNAAQVRPAIGSDDARHDPSAAIPSMAPNTRRHPGCFGNSEGSSFSHARHIGKRRCSDWMRRRRRAKSQTSTMTCSGAERVAPRLYSAAAPLCGRRVDGLAAERAAGQQGLYIVDVDAGSIMTSSGSTIRPAAGSAERVYGIARISRGHCRLRSAVERPER